MASSSHIHFFLLTFATSIQLPIEYTDAAVLELHGTADSLFFPILHYLGLGRLWINSTQQASTDAGAKHLNVRIITTTIHSFRKMIYRRLWSGWP